MIPSIEAIFLHHSLLAFVCTAYNRYYSFSILALVPFEGGSRVHDCTLPLSGPIISHIWVWWCQVVYCEVVYGFMTVMWCLVYAAALDVELVAGRA